MKAMATTLLFAGVIVMGAPASGQDRGTRSLVPVAVGANQTSGQTTLTLEVKSVQLGRDVSRDGATELRVGDRVEVCFASTTEGYVTVWSIDANASRAVIYPNRFSAGGDKVRAVKVEATKRNCIGTSPEFRLQVGAPAGEARIYLHWTRTEAEALGMDDYPVIGGGAGSRAPVAGYASQTLSYRVRTN
jgi:hypothetical protein